MPSSDTNPNSPHLRIHIATPNVRTHDAIGTDVIGMAAVLTAAGYRTEILTDDWDPACVSAASSVSPEAAHKWRFGDDLLIYHHSTHWPEGEQMLAQSRCGVVVRYHNVTPAAYFEGYSEPHTAASLAGLAATRRLAALPGAQFWGDSAFNCIEVIDFGAPRENCRVLPPFHGVEAMAREAPDSRLVAEYHDGSANIIFVGAFKPNKAHARAIRVFALYHHCFNPKSRLILIGSIQAVFTGYLDWLRQLATAYGVDGRVVFATSVSRAELRSYYLLADVFLCVSEHEGFCVPLIEAMYCQVPIVAWSTTAVSETLGGCALAWSGFDEGNLAESIHTCVEQADLSRNLRRMGRRHYDSCYAKDVLARRLLEYTAELAPHPAPAGAN